MKMTTTKPEVPDLPSLSPIRISVVEDDRLIREQLVHQVSHAEGFVIVSSHGSAENALAEIPELKPDVVLMDINLPKMSGIDCVRSLKSQLPSTHFIMLTVYEDADAIFKSLLAGAVGYLLKGRSGSRAQVIDAVRDATRGGSPLNSLIARKIVQYFHHEKTRSGGEHSLSTREREVLEQLSKGLLYKEIADVLNVNIETIRKHCHNIYEKLRVNSRTEAVVKYLAMPRQP
jgi:DNA-binding NarL/FixJ family response regulator